MNSKASFRRVIWQRITLIFVALALCALPAQLALSAASGSAITVTATKQVDKITGIDEIWLTKIFTQPGGAGKLAYGLRWALDNSGWFPVWRLELVSSTGLLPSASKAEETAGLLSVELKQVAPVPGHEYKASLSYSSTQGVLALKVLDTTSGVVAYSDGFAVPSYNGSLYALAGTSLPSYLPLGTEWTAGTEVEGGVFLPLDRFETRNEQGAIRLKVPGPAPAGEYRITLDHQGSQVQVADVVPETGENLIPLPISSMPLGESTLRLEYVEDGQVLLAEAKTITLGRVSLLLDEVDVQRSSGKLEAPLKFTTPTPSSEEVAVKVVASFSELVWDTAKRDFNEVPYKNDIVAYSGSVDLSTGEYEFPLELPLPDRPGNWRVRISAEVTPKMVTEIAVGERLFSTYLPAEIGDDEPYTIAVFPDTQYFTQSNPQILTRMTSWVAANAAEQNIAAVLHVGDMTDDNIPLQWERGYESMSLLHNVVPYVTTLGNHDMSEGSGGQIRRRGSTLRNNYFSVETAKKHSNLGGTMEPGHMEDYYSLFSIGGTDYIVIALEFGPPNEALEWANKVADQYSDRKLILLTHSYTSTHGTLSSSPSGYPIASDPTTTVNSAPEMWYNFVRRHPNSFMVISGHTAAPVTVPHRVGLTRAGTPVYELLFDFQKEDKGGNGWFGLLTFNPDNTIEVKVYSPYLDKVGTERDAYGFTSHLLIDLDEETIDDLRY